MASFDYGKDVSGGDPEAERALEETAEHVRIEGISADRVWETKNPAYQTVSLRDDRSSSGFLNVWVPTAQLAGAPDGQSYTVDFGLPDTPYTGSRKKPDGTYERVALTAGDVRTLFDRQQTPPNAYLNYVPGQFIHETSNPDYKVVSLPSAASESGFMNLTVDAKMVFPTTSRKTGEVVPNRYNVNLGPAYHTVLYDVKRDGAFVKEKQTAGNFAKQYEKNQRDWLAKRREADKQGPQDAETLSITEEEAVFA